MENLFESDGIFIFAWELMHFAQDILIIFFFWQELLHKNICSKDSVRCHIDDVPWLLDGGTWQGF